MAAGAGIKGPVIAMRRRARARDFGGNGGARAEAGVDHAGHVEAIERRVVIGEMLGLHAHLAVPIETEPGEVLEDGRGEFRSAARLVDVLEPEQEAPAGLARGTPGNARRICVTQMKEPRGAWREAGNDGAHRPITIARDRSARIAYAWAHTRKEPTPSCCRD